MRWSAKAPALVFAMIALLAVRAVADTVVNVKDDPGHGEICRFRAGDGNDPFQRWLSFGEVTCVPSGSVMTFPKGRWNVFARADGAVSGESVLIDGSKAPGSVTLSLLPAATLRVQLPPDHTGVLYEPKSVTAFPAAERMTVAAAQELWLFVLSKSVPVAVVVIPPMEAGSEHVVDARDGKALPAVVGWTQLSEGDRTALKTAHGVSLPRIRLTAAGKESEAAALPAPEALDGAFVLLPGLSGGELKLAGRGWLPVTRSITVGSQAVTLLHPPIVVRPSATLIVKWSTQDDLAALDRSFGSCQQQAVAPARLELTVSSCPPSQPGKATEPGACQPIRTETLNSAMTFGDVTIEDVPPGAYRAELRFGKLPPVAESMVLAPLDPRPLIVQAFYLGAYGSLTRGGQPLGEDARIEFPRGGVGFVARDTDEYHAVLRDAVGDDARIDVVTCRGQRTFVLTDKPMPRHGRFDLDIPDNVLTVTVVDTFTRASLPKATMRYVVMSSSVPRRPVVTRLLRQTNADTEGHTAEGEESGVGRERAEGRFEIKAVPQREIRLQVRNEGYKTQDVDPFSMTKSEKKELEVQLVPESGSQGRIISSHPFEKGTIYWFSNGGAETERTDLSPDGTFYFEHAHFRDETMTVVSFSHPLWITVAPPAERAKILEVNFPDRAPVREADVLVAGYPDRITSLVGVAIGGLRVPTAAFAQHQALRGLESLIHGAGPLHVPDLAASGPIDFLRGPSVGPMLRGQVVGNFVPLASQRLVPGIDRIVFGGK